MRINDILVFTTNEKRIERMEQSIGANIKVRRLALGLNQEALATELGVTQANVSRIEASDDPKVSTLRAVARALGCEPHELWASEESECLAKETGTIEAFIMGAIKKDPAFGGCLRKVAKDFLDADASDADWRFLTATLKLALGYASKVVRQNSNTKS
jgi:transcriptional regulator with XRE-family HTH domain